MMGWNGGIFMKTLYVSDLDGTLIRSDERTSEYTNQVINRLVAEGMIFSYATARSFHTSHKVTAGLNARIPLITYNGAMVVDNVDGSFLIKNFFGEEVRDILRDLFDHDVYPMVYGFVEGIEKFSFLPAKSSRSLLAFNETRRGDKRCRMVDTEAELMQGDIFYLTCIDEAEKLLPLYEKYKDRCHCVYQIDIYSGEPWLEIMPRAASKSNAIRQVQQMLGCDRLVVFGDGKNDIDMFEMADEAYAMANAVPELKAKATAVIGSNNEDGVAKWLEENV